MQKASTPKFQIGDKVRGKVVGHFVVLKVEIVNSLGVLYTLREFNSDYTESRKQKMRLTEDCLAV